MSLSCGARSSLEAPSFAHALPNLWMQRPYHSLHCSSYVLCVCSAHGTVFNVATDQYSCLVDGFDTIRLHTCNSNWNRVWISLLVVYRSVCQQVAPGCSAWY